jgi:DnaJ-class molecular chaperone
VTDHFAVLGIPRSPWLDADALKERFHRLSAQHHPDAPAGSGSAFTGINAAWQTLRDPSKCLRHYLELEHPGSLALAVQTPPELADLFMKIAAFRDATQRFTSRRAAASAPLTRALLEPERIALRTRLEELTAGITRRTDEIVATLRSGEPTPETLASLLASLVFLGKWSAHLAEARLTLN